MITVEHRLEFATNSRRDQLGDLQKSAIRQMKYLQARLAEQIAQAESMEPGDYVVNYFLKDLVSKANDLNEIKAEADRLNNELILLTSLAR